MRLISLLIFIECPEQRLCKGIGRWHIAEVVAWEDDRLAAELFSQRHARERRRLPGRLLANAHYDPWFAGA